MENKLTVDRVKAVEAYQLATPDQQRVLERIFGREAFQPLWQEDLQKACDDLGINAGDAFPGIHSKFDPKEAEVLNAYAALRILAKWVRGNWQPDWNDIGEKYHPLFDMSNGVEFYYSYYNRSHSGIGGGLCFPTGEMAEDFGRKYLDLYKIILTN